MTEEQHKKKEEKKTYRIKEKYDRKAYDGCVYGFGEDVVL